MVEVQESEEEKGDMSEEAIFLIQCEHLVNDVHTHANVVHTPTLTLYTPTLLLMTTTSDHE